MRLLVVLLTVISVGACGGLAWSWAKPIPPDPRVAGLVEENRQLKQETGRLRAQVGKLESVVVKAAKEAPEGGAKPPSQLSSQAPPSIEVSERVKSMMDHSRAEEVDRVYTKLMSRLGLNEKESAHFRQLLIDRERTSMEAALRAAKAPEADRKRLTEEMTKGRKAFDETFKKFLNNKEDYDLFLKWEDSKPERGTFERTGRALFDNSSQPLTEAQEDGLIDLMARGRKAHGSATFMPSVSKLEADAAEAKIVTWREQLTQIHAGMQQDAAALLTPSQLDIFTAFLGQQRDSLERSVRRSMRPR